MESSIKKRDANWDVVKGIGVLLMVIGHSGCPPYMKSFIFLFHMGLFYFVSGYFLSTPGSLWNWDKSLHFIQKKLKALYKPFIIWGLLFVLLHNLFYQWGWENECYTFHDILLKIASTLSFAHVEPLLIPLWFLKSLFCGVVVTYFVIQIRSKAIQVFIMSMLYVIGWCVSNMGIHLFFSLEREMVITPVVYLGYMMKDLNFQLSSLKFIAVAIILVISSMYITIDTAIAFFSFPLVYPMFAILGILFCYTIATYLKKWVFIVYQWLNFIGANSIKILILHFTGIKIMSAVLARMGIVDRSELYQLPIRSLIGSPWWIAFTMIGLGIPLIYIYVYKSMKRIRK